jgi:outer membrane receptor protein involved in Fe transport
MSPATAEEIGVRTNIIPKVQVQLAVFQEDFNSELAYDQDQGEDTPSAPSRRDGVEVSAQYHPFRWLEFNTDLAWSRARYRGSAETLAEFGLNQPFIANAPTFIGSFGILVDNLDPWFGGLQWRDLGRYPIVDGEHDPEDKGYSEVNLDVCYRITPKLRVEANVYNLFNTRANAAAYDYASRLVPDGPEVSGPQVHPLEPISGRFSLTYYF